MTSCLSCDNHMSGGLQLLNKVKQVVVCDGKGKEVL